MLSVLYYIHEEEKDQHPEAPELDRSRRALSPCWSDEGSQEGREQEGMPTKGTCMKIGDLVYDDYYGNGVVISIDHRWCGATIFFFATQSMCFLDERMRDSVEVLNESR